MEGMWAALTARQFGSFFLVHRGVDLLSQLGQVTYWIWANFLGVGLTLGLLGVLQNYRVDKRRLIFLGLAFVSSVLFFATYGALDRPFMFLTGYLIWTVWMLDGLHWLQDLLEKIGESSSFDKFTARWKSRMSVNRFAAITLLLPLAALAINFTYADLSSYTIVKERYPNIMSSFEPEALVLAWWPDSSPMYYYQQVEGLRKDVQVVDRYLISAEGEASLIARSYDSRPIYLFGKRLRALPPTYIMVPTIFGGSEVGYRLVTAQAGIAQPENDGASNIGP
jgi:hypothetical protein